MDEITAGAVWRSLPRRDPAGHKGMFGKVMCLCGCVGFTGAPVLAARAATRTGCGLVSLAVPNTIYPIVAQKCLEEMPFPLPSDYKSLRNRAVACDAVLVGPGLGLSSRAHRLVLGLAEDLEGTLVLDADGINALEKHMDTLERRRGRVTILTPHDGEFARIGGDLSGGDRLEAARHFAQRYGCILVLKGHRAIVANPEGRCYVNTNGNSGMAKGGSGDVLTGMLAGMVRTAHEPARVCELHGMAGVLAEEKYGNACMTSRDLLEMLPEAFRRLAARREEQP